MIHKNFSNLNGKLDRACHIVTTASVLSDEEAGKIASAPFLFTRVRAGIEAGQERREAAGVWLGFWRASKKALMAMGLAAAVSLGLSVYFAGNKPGNPAFSVDAYLGTDDSRIDSMVLAERLPLTTEEVLAIIGPNDQEGAK